MRMEFVLSRVKEMKRTAWPPGWKAVIGLIIPIAAPGVTYEFRAIAPEGVSIIEIPAALKSVTPEELELMGKEAVELARRLAPYADVISYACTAGAFVKGPDYDRQIIEDIEKATGRKSTSMATALVEGIKAFKARKVIIASPYLEVVTNLEVKYLSQQGIETAYHESLGIADAAVVCQRTPGENFRYALDVFKRAPEHAREGADALVITCGGMQTAEVIADLETATGLPVVTSLMANSWLCLRLAGVNEPITGFGKLMEL